MEYIILCGKIEKVNRIDNKNCGDEQWSWFMRSQYVRM